MNELKDMTNEEVVTHFLENLVDTLKANPDALALVVCMRELDDPKAKITAGAAWHDAGVEMRVTFRAIPKKRTPKKKEKR